MARRVRRLITLHSRDNRDTKAPRDPAEEQQDPLGLSSLCFCILCFETSPFVLCRDPHAGAKDSVPFLGRSPCPKRGKRRGVRRFDLHSVRRLIAQRDGNNKVNQPQGVALRGS
jgi:hypothetical protein